MRSLDSKSELQILIENNVTNGLGYTSWEKSTHPYYYQNDLDLQHCLGINEQCVVDNITYEMFNSMSYITIIKDWLNNLEESKILLIKYPSQINNIGQDLFTKCLLGKRSFEDVLDDYCSNRINFSFTSKLKD